MRLNEKQISKIILDLQNDFNAHYDKYNHIQALLSFPMGELMNPKIEGFVLVWKMLNKVRVCLIVSSDRFSAQGLEGAIRIETDLINALLAYRELPVNRRSISTIQKID